MRIGVHQPVDGRGHAVRHPRIELAERKSPSGAAVEPGDRFAVLRGHREQPEARL
jgi:hypothetical protein